MREGDSTLLGRNVDRTTSRKDSNCGSGNDGHSEWERRENLLRGLYQRHVLKSRARRETGRRALIRKEGGQRIPLAKRRRS